VRVLVSFLSLTVNIKNADKYEDVVSGKMGGAYFISY
jgi:hypothetical protein